MIKQSLRFISAAAASKMLRVGIEELDKLCSEKKITRYHVAGLPQYDFKEIAEFRRKNITSLQSKQLFAAQPPSPKPAEQGIQVPAERYNIVAQSVILKRQLEFELQGPNYQAVEHSLIPFFFECPLYTKSGNNAYTLYKPAEKAISNDDLSSRFIPNLFISPDDRELAMREMQLGLNMQLKTYVGSKSVKDVKHTIVNLLDVSLGESPITAIDGLEQAVQILVSAVSTNQEMIWNLLSLLEQTEDLIFHSARVMAFVMRFCFKNNYDVHDTQILSLSALLHDIGKTQLDPDLLSIDPNKLSDEDRIVIQCHPSIGYHLLKECGIQNKQIVFGALEHHERLDGSGYPNGVRKMSLLGQLIGLIDYYDSLKSQAYADGQARTPLDVLRLIKKECESGKFNRELFESFAYSLL